MKNLVIALLGFVSCVAQATSFGCKVADSEGRPVRGKAEISFSPIVGRIVDITSGQIKTIELIDSKTVYVPYSLNLSESALTSERGSDYQRVGWSHDTSLGQLSIDTSSMTGAFQSRKYDGDGVVESVDFFFYDCKRR